MFFIVIMVCSMLSAGWGSDISSKSVSEPVRFHKIWCILFSNLRTSVYDIQNSISWRPSTINFKWYRWWVCTAILTCNYTRTALGRTAWIMSWSTVQPSVLCLSLQTMCPVLCLDQLEWMEVLNNFSFHHIRKLKYDISLLINSEATAVSVIACFGHGICHILDYHIK